MSLQGDIAGLQANRGKIDVKISYRAEGGADKNVLFQDSPAMLMLCENAKATGVHIILTGESDKLGRLISELLVVHEHLMNLMKDEE